MVDFGDDGRPVSLPWSQATECRCLIFTVAVMGNPEAPPYVVVQLDR